MLISSFAQTTIEPVLTRLALLTKYWCDLSSGVNIGIAELVSLKKFQKSSDVLIIVWGVWYNSSISVSKIYVFLDAEKFTL